MFLFNGCSVNDYHHRANSDKSCCQKKVSKSEVKKKCTSSLCKIKNKCKKCVSNKNTCTSCADCKDCEDCVATNKCSSKFCSLKEGQESAKPCCGT